MHSISLLESICKTFAAVGVLCLTSEVELMEKWNRRSTFIWLPILLFLCIVWVSPVRSQQGFLSIDCGSEEDYTDNTTGIFWQTDGRYISTGKNAKNITVTSASSTILNTGQEGTLRYFTEQRSRDCYLVRTKPRVNYLIRTTFFYGDWTWNLNDSAISFSVYINSTFWFTLEYDSGSDLSTSNWWEGIFYSPGSELNLCLVRGQGPSFISTLELRELASGMYSTVVAPTTNVFIDLWARYNCGPPVSGPPILRYPDDIYDRFWWTPGTWDSATHITKLDIVSSPSTSAPNRPPLAVMQDAWVYYDSDTLYYSTDFGYPVGNVYTASYFQELDGNASATNVRGMTYFLNHERIKSFNSSDQTLEVDGPIQDISDYFVNMTFVQANWSRLRPILNALELYEVHDMNMSQTAVEDVSAISALQSRLNFTDWSGDPCLPVPYDWMGCSADKIYPTLFRVTNLSLVHKGIDGTIPPEIFSLTSLIHLSLNDNNLTGSIFNFSNLLHLQTLYLQNNDLSGNIPSSLGDALPNLTQLHVDNNNLTGAVPVNLVTKPGLNFSYANNSDLVCDTSACKNTTTASNNSSKRFNIGAVVGGILGGLAALVIVSGLIWFLCTRKKRARSSIIRSITQAEISKHGELSINRQALSGAVALLSLQDVSNATNKFSRRIGVGSFGPVYYGKLPSGQEVAVKVKSAESRQGFNEFLNEVDLLSRIHHRNLVSLVGYCEEGEQQILVYVYVPNGTLRDYLYGDTSKRRLNWRTRLDIVLNSARGLEYLHTDCNPRIIHRDVKSSNILLDESMVAKVSDFGISKMAPEGTFSGVDTVLKGTPGYIDPEYFISQRLTQKSDVYSFGIVLLEIISGRHPHITELPDGTSATLIQWARSSVEDGKATDIADPSMKGGFNHESMIKVVSLALTSTSPVTSNRPDMGQVVRGLVEAIELELFDESALKADHDGDAIAEDRYDYYHYQLQSLPGSEVTIPDGGSILEPR